MNSPQSHRGPSARRWSALTTAVLLGLASSSLSAGAGTPLKGRHTVTESVSHPWAGRLLVRYKTGSKAASAALAAREAAAQVSRTAGLAQAQGVGYLKSVSPRLHVVSVPESMSAADTQTLMQRLRSDPAVESVEVDRRVRPHALPADPYFTSTGNFYQWHLQSSASVAGAINAAGAWVSSTGSGVVVAVLDGGYRPHADLAANVLPGHDFISADSPGVYWTANDGDGRDSDATDPGDWVGPADAATHGCTAEDSTWHGTHVAGLVAAVSNTDAGVGVAHGARVLAVRVLGRCGGFTSDILAGARWAAGLSVPGVTATLTPARVLNLSLGVEGACDSTSQSVVDEIRAAGVSVVASAGNDGLAGISSPGNCGGVIAVTAHTREGDSADYANVGAGVDISAPGGGANTVLPALAGMPRQVSSTGNAGITVPGADNQLLYQGTSMAAPQVAGVLALMAQARPDLSQASLEAIMRGAARAFPAGGYCALNLDGLPAGFCGSGLLDAQAAVAAALVAPANAADLEVTQAAPSNGFPYGASVSYNLAVRNVGTATATGVQIVVTAAAGLELQSVTTGSGASLNTSATGWTATLPSLAAGQEAVFGVTVRAAAHTGQGSIAASVSTASAETTLANNEDLLSAPLEAPVPPVGGSDSSGGGCTVAADGRSDAGLPLLLLATLLLGLWRRLRAR